MWLVAGAALGWIGFTYLRFNEERGPVVSAIIGGIGGVIGGQLIAPMFTAAPAVVGAFSTAALIFAAIVAAAFLAIGNLVSSKWGV
jgi:uncharacterized membrane protein YeaQ/YmgE (transglycosylase-associated protein family)